MEIKSNRYQLTNRLTLSLYGSNLDICSQNEQTVSLVYFSCLGFYPVCPGKPSYQVGLPQFKEVRLELPSGQVTILT
ncbi:glycoside hydrolase family 92 protein [Streptococcus suis]|nr:glycoside hydrolase family 92 protein [Streptococcus suis]